MKQRTFLEALILAHNAGPEYRVCSPGLDMQNPDCRFRWNMDKSGVSDGGWETDRLVGGTIIRPARREVSLIEALHWASQDESREFTCYTGRYRVRNNRLQYWASENKDWLRATGNWDMRCIIDEGWEEVELEVTPK